MDDKITYWASVTFGAASLLLLVLTVSFINSNRALQEETTQRQITINRATTLAQVDQNIVQALAAAAIKNGNNAARDLLAAQGITIKPTAASAPASDETSAADAKPKKAKKKVEHTSDENANGEVQP
jgi:hypothetical protein